MKDLERKIKKHLKERGWDKLCPSDLAKSIMIEGAELLELFQWENLPPEQVKKDKDKMSKIKKELADVLIYALDMSVTLGIDTEKIIYEKLDAVNKKYPANLVRLQPDKKTHSPASREYWRIKGEYRKNEN